MQVARDLFSICGLYRYIVETGHFHVAETWNPQHPDGPTINATFIDVVRQFAASGISFEDAQRLKDLNHRVRNLAEGRDVNNAMPFPTFPSDLQLVVKGNLIHVKPNASSTGPHNLTRPADGGATVCTNMDNKMDGDGPQGGDTKH